MRCKNLLDFFSPEFGDCGGEGERAEEPDPDMFAVSLSSLW